MTLHIVDMPVVSSIPAVQGLVQAVYPVRGGRHICNFFARHIFRHELRDGMADEHVGVLDIVPEVFPDIRLGRALNAYHVALDLDMRSI
jgi:hypothetical protein